MRSCSSRPINDCKEISGITYCYCSGQLCNRPDGKASGTVITRETGETSSPLWVNDDDSSDDDDDDINGEFGSGSVVEIIDNEPPSATTRDPKLEEYLR